MYRYLLWLMTGLKKSLLFGFKKNLTETDTIEENPVGLTPFVLRIAFNCGCSMPLKIQARRFLI